LSSRQALTTTAARRRQSWLTKLYHNAVNRSPPKHPLDP
jgi:hypothetical protein